MVGTYGSGVMGLDRAGHFQSFDGATVPSEVNPNAMLVTALHVFAGTLGNGLYIYDRATARWSTISFSSKRTGCYTFAMRHPPPRRQPFRSAR